MDIGSKLKESRLKSDMTQEQVAEAIGVSRQSISNWENEKNYPDIISVIQLSELYGVSLDVLLKGDEQMMQHLEESTNIVKSNKCIAFLLLINVLLMVILFIFVVPLSNHILTAGIFAVMFIISGSVIYQLIQRI
ncbi:helix-turn-helix domain-containing protein [Vagococcus acidifermentans]|uniref:Transcriptional regulator n=1 Tax=Vagococcus acidifermentans TaxID=564710 RepID=A0A430AT14_9ENTE|nr:helix-turn-helix transcriptional regulator [Vagococcus acidifermentans]RSU11194.1 transcriptional regulator [Vagococcus acidifermentans]